MKFKILKIWPLWPAGLLYHDQYLDLVMRNDDITTLFIVPSFVDKNYTQFTHEYTKEFDVIYIKSVPVFGKPLPYDLIYFFKKVREFKPSVIHIFGISNFISVAAVFIAYLLGYGRRIIFNDHSDPRERKKSISATFYYAAFRFFFRVFVNRKSYVITPDLASEREIKRRYGPLNSERLLQIPLGYDSSVFCIRGVSRFSDKKLRVGFAGKINEAKRLETLLCALRKVDAAVECRIVGMPVSDYTEYQIQFVALVDAHNRQSDNKVILEQFIEKPSALAEFYNEMDVVVYPGSISITTQEATGCGTPIILYESYEGLEHRVADGRGWLFTEDEDLVFLINQVFQLHLENRIDKERISTAAYTYSWDNLKFDYYSIYIKMTESSYLKSLIEARNTRAIKQLPSERVLLHD